MACGVRVWEPGPNTFEAELSRRHRWVRGDWQLLPWILGFGLGARVSGEVPRLDWLSRWKLIDNLRRSLMPVVFTLLYGSVIVGDCGFVVLLLILSLQRIGDVLQLLRFLATDRGTVREKTMGASLLGLRSILGVALLPTDCMNSINAIATALVRCFVTRRGLLEWRTFHDVERRVGSDGLVQLAILLWPSVVAGLLALAVTFSLYEPASVGSAVGTLWASAPILLNYCQRRPRCPGRCKASTTG